MGGGSITGFDGFRFGIEVGGNFQQHSRKPNIVSGLGQFPSAGGSLPEMNSVQNDLLLSARRATHLGCSGVASRPTVGIPIEQTLGFFAYPSG